MGVDRDSYSFFMGTFMVLVAKGMAARAAV